MQIDFGPDGDQRGLLVVVVVVVIVVIIIGTIPVDATS